MGKDEGNIELRATDHKPVKRLETQRMFGMTRCKMLSEF